MKIIKRVRAYLRKYKAARKLKMSGHDTWASYRHMHDPDICRSSLGPKDFYIGYPYVYKIASPDHYAYQSVDGFMTCGYDIMRKWCEKNIRYNYRMDYHRVFKDHFTRELFNEMAGDDMIYFAFNNEQDYLLFVLRWG